MTNCIDQITKEVLQIGAAAIRAGVTTDDIGISCVHLGNGQSHRCIMYSCLSVLDEIVHKATIERNAYPSPLGYWNYPKSCCTSVNEVICHGNASVNSNAG